MSSYNIVIAEAAQRDLLDIFDYIAFELREPVSARRLLSKIRNKIKSSLYLLILKYLYTHPHSILSYRIRLSRYPYQSSKYNIR